MTESKTKMKKGALTKGIEKRLAKELHRASGKSGATAVTRGDSKAGFSVVLRSEEGPKGRNLAAFQVNAMGDVFATSWVEGFCPEEAGELLAAGDVKALGEKARALVEGLCAKVA